MGIYDFPSPLERPICKRCGHGPGEHSTSVCQHGANVTYKDIPTCDCRGWERDEAWPDPRALAALKKP